MTREQGMGSETDLASARSLIQILVQGHMGIWPWPKTWAGRPLSTAHFKRFSGATG